MQSSTRLYTFTLSHFCEKARWALDRAGVEYREVVLLPGFHRRRLRQLGAHKQVPVLVHAGQVFEGSSAILDFADAHGGAPPLLPSQPDLRAEALEWEVFLDRELGETVRRVLYFHALERPEIVIRCWSGGGPFWASSLYRLIWPRAAAALRRLLDIDASTARRDAGRLDVALERVEARLAEHNYLVGESFSRADLTLAALCAPLLRPPEHPWRLPDVLEQLPEVAALARRVRQSATGKRVAAAYARRRDDPVFGRYLRTIAAV